MTLSKLDLVDAMNEQLLGPAAAARLAGEGAFARGNREEARVFHLLAEAMEGAIAIISEEVE